MSADLDTLARTPIAVVSSGVKSILDIRRTLERLESLGVLVIGFKTDELPGFYFRSTGLPLEHRMYRPIDVANAVRVRLALGQGGVLVANPISADAEIPQPQIDEWLEVARDDADRVGVRGKDVTPFLMARLAGLSAGRTVVANRALAEANAVLAGMIASSLARDGGDPRSVRGRPDDDEFASR